MISLWYTLAAVLVVSVLLVICIMAYAAYVAYTEKPEQDDTQEQEDLKHSDDLNDEFTKRLHELHSTRFGKPMVDPRTVKRDVVMLKDRQLTKRKKD